MPNTTGVAVNILAYSVTGLGTSIEKQFTVIILLLSCLGAILAGWWHMRLFSPEDADILAPTPIDKSTMLRHNIRSNVSAVAVFLLVTFGVSSLNGLHFDYLGSTWISWIITCECIMLVSCAIFLIAGNYVNYFRLVVGAIAVLVFLVVVQYFLPNMGWHTYLSTPLQQLWPPAWMMDVLQGTLSSIQVVVLAAILGSSVYHLIRQLKQWQFLRARHTSEALDDEDEHFSELMEIYENHSSGYGAEDRLADGLLPDISIDEPKRSSQMIEWVIWKLATPFQRDLVALSGFPPYFRRWMKSLLACVVGAVILRYNADGFRYHSLLHIANIVIFVYSALSIFPLGTLTRFLTDQIQISSLATAPAYTMIPVSYRDIIVFRWKEGLVRTLFAAPVLTYLMCLWRSDADYSNARALWIGLNSLGVVIWCLVNWIHLMTCGLFVNHYDGSSVSNHGWFFKMASFVLLLGYFVCFVGTAFAAYAFSDFIGMDYLLIGLLPTLIFAGALSQFTRRFYQSSHSDFTARVK